MVMELASPEVDLKDLIAQRLKEFDAAVALIHTGIFKVRTLGGGMVPFLPKPFQAKLYDRIRKQMARGLPVKIIILKARQMGFSTAIAVLFLALSIVRDAVVTLVTAHEKKSADKIFAIYRRAMHNLPEDKKPECEFDSMRHMVFENSESEIAVEIAVHGKTGRSDTVTYAHFSEYAWWDEQPETLQAALSALPKVCGTIAIIETTANGWGDDFHQKWVDAEESWKESDGSDWEPLFMAWYQEKTYRLKIPEDYEQTPEETMFQQQHKLDRTQVNWRRHTIRSECGNDETLFDREFPTTPTHAFRSTGERVFDQKALEFLQDKFGCGPIGTFDVGVTLAGEPYREFNEKGFFRVYREPVAGHEYVIAADPTHNVGSNPDEAAAHVFDATTREQVAAFSGAIGADEFGDVLVGIAKLYNWAYLIIESNIGKATVKRVFDGWAYGNIHYYRPVGVVGSEPTFEMGFNTSPKTRADAIHVTKRLVKEKLIAIYDLPTYAELQQFKEVEKGEKKKAQAPKGKQDNLVMALCILCYVANDRWRWISLENYLKAIAKPIEFKEPPITKRHVLERFAAKRRREAMAGVFGVQA